jgi:hypothetical protein
VTVDWYKKDRYGRLVGTVTLGRTDIGLEQIRAGLAWHYKAYQHEQTQADRERYAAMEDEARASRRGLWQDSDAVAPWKCRQRRELPAPKWAYSRGQTYSRDVTSFVVPLVFRLIAVAARASSILFALYSKLSVYQDF